MKATLFDARTLLGRFGIIEILQMTRYTLEGSLRSYSLQGLCAGARTYSLGTVELDTEPGKEVLAIIYVT
jgi:Asp/Glu/hydantoin racemase